MEGVDLFACMPVAVRAHLLAGQVEAEHRQVTVAFIHFDGIDRLVVEEGAEYVAYGLDQLVTEAQRAAEEMLYLRCPTFNPEIVLNPACRNGPRVFLYPCKCVKQPMGAGV